MLVGVAAIGGGWWYGNQIGKNVVTDAGKPGKDVLAVIDVTGTVNLKANTTYGVWLLLNDDAVKEIADNNAVGPSGSQDVVFRAAEPTPQPTRPLPTPTRDRELPGMDPSEPTSPTTSPPPSDGDTDPTSPSDPDTTPTSPPSDTTDLDEFAEMMQASLAVTGPNGEQIDYVWDTAEACTIGDPKRAVYGWKFTTKQAGAYQITGMPFFPGQLLVAPDIQTVKDTGTYGVVILLAGVVSGALATIQLIWGLIWRHRRVKRARAGLR